MNRVTRRGFLGSAAAPWIARASNERRPNILIFIADDLSYTEAGYVEDSPTVMPNIGSLAGRSVLFNRAFTATAMCAPMRQQMYTGIFPVRNGAYPNHSQIKPGIKTWPSYFLELGYRVGLAGKRHFGPREAYPFEYLPDGQELDFGAIEEFVRRNPKEPYCLFVCSHQPHAPHDKGDPSRFPTDRIRVPDYWVDTPLTRKTLAAYYAECEYLDWEVGRCREIVRKSGREADTIFAFCSEQGSGFPFAKWTLYDLGVREAAFIHWPRRIPRGVMVHAIVQAVDWLPTLLEAAGGTPPEEIDGRSFLPVLLGKAHRHAPYAYGVHTTRGIINGSDCYPIRSIRTERYKLILNLNHEAEFSNAVTRPDRYNYWDAWVEKAKTDPAARRIVDRYLHRPAEEFYDLWEDPFEQQNLAGRPQYRRRIEEMKKRLFEWMESQGDRGVETEMLAKPRPLKRARNRPGAPRVPSGSEARR